MTLRRCKRCRKIFEPTKAGILLCYLCYQRARAEADAAGQRPPQVAA